jgi:AbrB family looped-hinge helix DNA binding protein
MSTPVTVRVEPTGAITLPEELRDVFDLDPGAEVVLEVSTEGILLRPAVPPKPIWQRIAELGESLPEEEQAKLPTDLAAQHDHYLYGTPKRPE